MIKTYGDIDIDFADRNYALKFIEHVPAKLETGEKHKSGIYVNPLPIDSITNLCAWDYKEAEELGFFKLDFLNNSVYTMIETDEELNYLMTLDPPWHLLTDKEFFEKIVHINGHWNVYSTLAEPVNSMARMAMFLAIIRPAKRHLLGKSWQEIAKTVWMPDETNRYFFKKSHSVAYAYLVGIHMTLTSL